MVAEPRNTDGGTQRCNDMNFNINIRKLSQDANTTVNTTAVNAVVLPGQWRELKRQWSTEAAKVRIKNRCEKSYFTFATKYTRSVQKGRD